MKKAKLETVVGSEFDKILHENKHCELRGYHGSSSLTQIADVGVSKRPENSA